MLDEVLGSSESSDECDMNNDDVHDPVGLNRV